MTEIVLRKSRRGANQFNNPWTSADDERLLLDYERHAVAGNLAALAADMRRTVPFICRKARGLGLTVATRAQSFLVPQTSEAARERIWRHGHPRGFAGRTHTATAKAKSGAASAAMWAALDDEGRAALTVRQMKGKETAGVSAAPERLGATWKAGWREIGGVRKFFRSRWEANYARYLEWLRQRGEIEKWEHEAETFWFDGIKRGCRSYLPDFRVTERGGAVVYHEVKGWMDDRSKTKIARMGRYHPKVRLIVVDGRAYRAIAAQVSRLIEGWE